MLQCVTKFQDFVQQHYQRPSNDNEYQVHITVAGLHVKNGVQFGGESLLAVAACNACGLEQGGGG